mgnify:CR=1 FL=1
MSGMRKLELAAMANAIAMMSAADEMRRDRSSEFMLERELMPDPEYNYRFIERKSGPNPRRKMPKSLAKSRSKSKAARKARKRNRG